jgi:predicted TIM-barrel fold metal-dependent hydrolase
MTVIDVHTHAWPDAIAERAVAGSFSDLKRFGDGRVPSLVEALDRSGIDRAVCLAVANTPRQVEGANRFVGSLDRERLIGFGSVHAGLSVEENLAALRTNRLCGVKIHPLFQNYGLDDPGLLRTLDAMQGEFIALFHVGAGNEQAGELCTPAMMRRVIEMFPGLDVIACHFGGYRLLDEAEENIIGLPVYVDTAWPPSLGDVDPERLRAIIERHGPERVLFGSDWPMASPADELTAVRGLGLGPEQTAGVLGDNMKRLLERYEKDR